MRSLGLLLVVLSVLVAVGCDAGGLLGVGSSHDGGVGGSPVTGGPSVTEIVNGGTVVKNGKYKLVFTLGQGTPNQGPSTGPNNRDNGGLVGAMNGP